jgi:hypothetical protein
MKGISYQWRQICNLFSLILRLLKILHEATGRTGNTIWDCEQTNTFSKTLGAQTPKLA